MDIIAFFALTILSAIGLGTSLSLGANSICTSIETGTPIDVVFVLTCVAVIIPCAIVIVTFSRAIAE